MSTPTLLDTRWLLHGYSRKIARLEPRRFNQHSPAQVSGDNWTALTPANEVVTCKCKVVINSVQVVRTDAEVVINGFEVVINCPQGVIKNSLAPITPMLPTRASKNADFKKGRPSEALQGAN